MKAYKTDKGLRIVMSHCEKCKSGYGISCISCDESKATELKTIRMIV